MNIVNINYIAFYLFITKLSEEMNFYERNVFNNNS